MNKHVLFSFIDVIYNDHYSMYKTRHAAISWAHWLRAIPSGGCRTTGDENGTLERARSRLQAGCDDSVPGFRAQHSAVHMSGMAVSAMWALVAHRLDADVTFPAG